MLGAAIPTFVPFRPGARPAGDQTHVLEDL